MRKFATTERFEKDWKEQYECFLIRHIGDSVYDEEYAILDSNYLEQIDRDWEKFKEDFLPKRATKHSAGYDLKSTERCILYPSIFTEVDDELVFLTEPSIVHTGIKVYMEEDEVFKIYNRSSNPIKKGLILSNSVGIVDKDFCDNISTEGEIMFQFYNVTNEPIVIEVGDRLGQGIFSKFLKTDDDYSDKERVGGHGSTG